MQIISIEPLPSSESRRRITLDTRESFVLYAGELVKHPELRTSAFIDEDYYQQIKDTILRIIYISIRRRRAGDVFLMTF